MPSIVRDGVTLHYSVVGEGPPILFSHGFAAGANMWKPQQEGLSDRYQVIAWDMRGHGASDSPDDPSRYSEAETLADMVAILDACGAEQAVIAGLSMGGYMSLAFQLAFPERVSALILSGAGPGYRKDDARADWNAYAGKQADKYLERGLDAVPDAPESLAAGHRSATGLAHAARGMLAQTDARIINHLASLQLPVLLLTGAKDRAFLGATDYMAARIPGAVKVLVPDAGHAVNMHQPEAYNAAVRDFLETNLPRN